MRGRAGRVSGAGRANEDRVCEGRRRLRVCSTGRGGRSGERTQRSARNKHQSVAADGSRAFGYVPLARVRRWSFLVTIVTNSRSFGRPLSPAHSLPLRGKKARHYPIMLLLFGTWKSPHLDIRGSSRGLARFERDQRRLSWCVSSLCLWYA